MKNARLFQSLFTLLAALMLAMPIAAQQQDASTAPANKDQMASATVATVPAGQKQKLNGIIIQRDVDNLMVRDYKGATYKVNVSGNTSIKERKSNPFRGAKKYAVSDLSRGLAVEVEGRGDDNGALVANQIKFSEAEFRVANSVVSMVTPVEGRVSETENRITHSRNRYIQTVAEFNKQVRFFPTNLTAKFLLGMQPRETFKATAPGADKAPDVQF